MLRERQFLIVLGIITCIAALLGILFYESPTGTESLCSAGLIAGLGWILSGFVFRQKLSLKIMYALFMIAAGIGMVPFLMLAVFALHPVVGDNFVMIHNQIPDPYLGSVIKPNSWGHDSNGFRNERVPNQVDIVTIGDSQTWGYNVARDESWPYRLGDLRHQTVYNMSLGGFGPVEYSVLVDRALDDFSPEVIIIGLYFGNDLYDAYEAAYTRDVFSDLRDPSAEPALLTDTIGPAVLAADNATPDAVYPEGHIRTEFNTPYRILALDLEEPRIAEGLRITESMLITMKNQTSARSTRFIVLLIPTKELVYESFMVGRGSVGYDRLIQMEHTARAQIIETLEGNQIEYVDALPALVAALNADRAIYKNDIDGHPIAAGYNILAETLLSVIATDS